MIEASVSFAGNLTNDPDVHYTEAGITRAMLRVAVSGRREQEPSFFTVPRPGRLGWGRVRGWGGPATRR